MSGSDIFLTVFFYFALGGIGGMFGVAGVAPLDVSTDTGDIIDPRKFAGTWFVLGLFWPLALLYGIYRGLRWLFSGFFDTIRAKE